MDTYNKNNNNISFTEMTQQEINHEIAIFDGWRLAKIGTYYYKGRITDPDVKVAAIDTLNYYEDWNLAHSAWMKFCKILSSNELFASIGLDNIADAIIHKIELHDKLCSYPSPMEFTKHLHQAIIWYNNLNKQS